MAVISFMKDLLKTATNSHSNCNEAVTFGDLSLPPAHMRQCTVEFRDDEYFVKSAEEEVRKLVEHCGLCSSSRVLEIGCGSGRLPIGLMRVRQPVASYDGIDVDKDAIKWCKRWIGSQNDIMNFNYINVYNERYNPKGNVHLNDSFRFDFPDNHFDVIYSYSVFTHMEVNDIKVYLRECKRLLTLTGKIFVTAYLEDDVPDTTINPNDYRPETRGPLHRVRLNREYFNNLLKPLGLRMFQFNHNGEHDGQSGIYMSKS